MSSMWTRLSQHNTNDDNDYDDCDDIVDWRTFDRLHALDSVLAGCRLAIHDSTP